jgi:hypothetical protein
VVAATLSVATFGFFFLSASLISLATYTIPSWRANAQGQYLVGRYSRFGFRSFALLLRRPESSNSLLLDFLTLALSFRLGRCSCLALLLRCQLLFPCLLQLAVGWYLSSFASPTGLEIYAKHARPPAINMMPLNILYCRSMDQRSRKLSCAYLANGESR